MIPIRLLLLNYHPLGLGMMTMPTQGNFLVVENEPLIESLCHQGKLGHAVDVLSRTDRALSANAYMCLLRTCNKNEIGTVARKVCNHLTHHNIQLSGFLGNYLVVILSKCAGIDDAQSIFMALPERTVFSWTAMISAHVTCGHAEEAIQMLLLYWQMHQEGIQSDPVTLMVALRACSILAETGKTLLVARNSTKIAALEIGRAVHAAARKKRYAHDLAVGNTIISMYGKCGALLDAEHLFEAVQFRNVVTWVLC
ncbi:hypothetical protein L7F22_062713 [Adiantum nelumboides]|nr:hypothetical protein [Adiantum nelumboides]